MSFVRRVKSSVLVLGMVTLLLAGLSCYPYTAPNTSDYDVVVSLYDQNVDFGSLRTFSMPDSVMHLFGEDGEDLEDISRIHDAAILSRVANNMARYGYTREMDPESNPPDVFILVGVTSSTFFGADYVGGGYWGWYWGYYPGYGPGWGWLYPPYWGGGYVTYEYAVGTLLIVMADLEEADIDNRVIPVYWLGALNGVLSENPATARLRLNAGIDQAFEQSPYLETDQ